MKTVIVYRPVSEHARPVQEFAHEFLRRNPQLVLELTDIDSQAGDQIARAYDITSYPAVLVLQHDGAASMVWQGLPLPLLDEVAAYC